MHTWDRVDNGPAPLAPLVAIAQATTRLRVLPVGAEQRLSPSRPSGTGARNYRSPERRSASRLASGRATPYNEYQAIRSPLLTLRPSERLAWGRPSEILRSLLDGEEVVFRGEYYRIDGLKTMKVSPNPCTAPREESTADEPFLTHRTRHADIIGLTMLGRTLGDGNRHEVKWQEQRLDDTVAYSTAGGRIGLGSTWSSMCWFRPSVRNQPSTSGR